VGHTDFEQFCQFIFFRPKAGWNGSRNLDVWFEYEFLNEGEESFRKYEAR